MMTDTSKEDLPPTTPDERENDTQGSVASKDQDLSASRLFIRKKVCWLNVVSNSRVVLEGIRRPGLCSSIQLKTNKTTIKSTLVLNFGSIILLFCCNVRDLPVEYQQQAEVCVLFYHKNSILFPLMI